MGNGKWIVLDRDGTLIEDTGYLSDPDDVRILPGVVDGLRLLAGAGYRFIVITNQSGIGRGYFTEDDALAVNARTEEILRNSGIVIEGFYCCPHAPDDGCRCRKPGTALAERAARELGFSLDDISCVIGDKQCDALLGGKLKTRSILIGMDSWREAAACGETAADFPEAARRILGGWRGTREMINEDTFLSNLKLHIETAEKTAGLSASVAAAAELVTEALLGSGRVFFCGNGGSAADAQHLAAELSGRYLKDRRPLDGAALHCNASALTAIGNDYGFDEIFARQLSAHGRKGDVLVALSTGGGSANVLKALAAARSIGIHTIGVTGNGGGKMKDLADVLIAVPSASTPRIQEMHIFIGHVLCEMVERACCPD